MRCPRLSSVTLFVAALLLTVAVGAQPASSTAADALFAEGRAAMDRKDYAVACAKFAESDRLDPAVGTKLNLATCEQERGRVVTAWEMFRSALDALPKDDPRRSFAETQVQALEPRLPHLKLVAKPGHTESMHVRVAGLTLAGASFGTSIPLDPGDYEVVVETPGRPSEHGHVTLVEGTTAELSVPLSHATESTSPERSRSAVSDRSTGPRTVTAPSTPPDDLRRTLAFVAGGIGGVGLVVGTIAGVLALKNESAGNENCFDATHRCNQRGIDANERAHTFATVSTVGFIAGGIGVGVGGYLYFTAPAPSARADQALSVGYRGVW